MLQVKELLYNQISANGECVFSSVSQPKGSPHSFVCIRGHKRLHLLAATRIRLDRHNRQRRQLLRRQSRVKRDEILFIQLPPLREIGIKGFADFFDR